MVEAFVGSDVIAKHLGVSVITVCKLARSHEIPAIKYGRDWRFKLTEVDAHLSRPQPIQSARSRGRKRK